MYCSPVPVNDIASTWIERLGLMLNALVRDRDTIPPERSIDVRFDEFMADEMAVVTQVYEQAGEALDDDARAAIGGYLAGHQRGRLGTVATSPEMFGLTSKTCATRSPPTSPDSWPDFHREQTQKSPRTGFLDFCVCSREKVTGTRDLRRVPTGNPGY